MPGAGQPVLNSLPSVAGPHIRQLQTLPWAASLFAAQTLSAADFKMVEVDPLIAFQLTISKVRSGDHCAKVSNPPSIQEMLDICFPLQPPTEQLRVQSQDNSLILKARSLNIQKIAFGMFDNQFLGLTFGPSPPFVQAVQHNGKYYLWNGFHRAYGLRSAGATYIPCAVRKILDPNEAKVLESVFPLSLLESAEAPTLAHFTGGRAHDVSLKLTSRVLHVSWAQWTVLDE